MAVMRLIIYAVLSSLFLQAYAQSKPDCSADIGSFCASCRTVIVCPTAVSNTTSNATCSSAQACLKKNCTAVCSATASVSACKCKSTSGISYQCDPYDSGRQIACYNGAVQNNAACSTGQVCLATTGKCGTPPPTTPQPMTPRPTTIRSTQKNTTTARLSTASSVVTATPCSSDVSTPIKKNCTAFYFCVAGQYPNYLLCNPGEIFTNKDQNCIAYTTVNCTGKTGFFADPFNCSLLHNCTGGTDSISSCPTGQYFSESSGTCVNNATSPCMSEECTPCKSAADIFPVDSSKCTKQFKQCAAANNNGRNDGFTISLRTCPGTFVFDPTKKACTKNCTITRNDVWNFFW